MAIVRNIPNYPDWKEEITFEDESGSVVRTYKYKGESAGRIVLDDSISLQAAGYALIDKDLRNAFEWLEDVEAIYKEKGITKENEEPNIPDKDEGRRLKSLLISMCTIYGKCFTSADGRRVKLGKNNIDKKYIETHDDIMEMRNNYAAHSGEEKIETGKIVLAITLDDPNEGQLMITTEIDQPASVGIDDINKIKELIMHLRDYVSNKSDQLMNKICEDVLKVPPEEWLKMVK